MNTTPDTQHIHPPAQTAPMNIVIVGHVDHGKSTLIGRLLYETDSLPEGKYDDLKAMAEKRNMPLEWSFVLDSFQAERDQAVTIDTTRIGFKTEHRPYVIIDAPGHREFLQNMISGAADAAAAILVVDANEGVQEQTRRHAYLLSILGLSQVIVVVNKMDLVEYNQNRFETISAEITDYLAQLHLTPKTILPIAAREGDGLKTFSEHLSWFQGQTLLGVLDQFEAQAGMDSKPLRFPVQDVYKSDHERIIVGRVESGGLNVGEMLTFSPSNVAAKVQEIKIWPDTDTPKHAAQAGESIGITLDSPIFVERGDIASHEHSAPALTNVFRCHLFWLSDHHLIEGKTYTLKLGTHQVPVFVHSIDSVIDTQHLIKQDQTNVNKYDIAHVTFRSQSMLALDSYQDHRTMGRCVILDGYDTVGGGTISMEGYPDQRHAIVKASNHLYQVDHLLSSDERAARNGHKGAVVWLTGLSGAGKSTLAMHVERKLFAKGYQTYVLDGDNVRNGLNADLGFSPKDRTENIRRIGEVAALQSDAGLIVLTAFISPYRADRDRARTCNTATTFHEVYVKADLETCETRDPKGLYKKARTGEIKEFTGISSPYEAPENPELVIDTAQHSIEDCVDKIVTYIEGNVKLKALKTDQNLKRSTAGL